MSEGDPPVAANVIPGHLKMPGHLEMTSSQSHMETDESGARARRRAEEAEVADRGTPPKRPPPAAGSEGHLEMPGHLEMAQGGKKPPTRTRQSERGEIWRAKGAVARQSSQTGSCEPPGGLRNAEGRRRTPGKYGSRIGKQEGSEGEGNARRTGKRRDPWPRQRAEDEQDQTLLEHHLPRWPDAHMMRMMCDACGTRKNGRSP